MRTLALNLGILLFDESTSALYSEMFEEVLIVKKNLTAQSLIMVGLTNETGFACDATDCVIFMNGRYIVKKDNSDVLLTKPKESRTKKILYKVF